MVLFFMALHFMTLGSAVTLRYTAPLLLPFWLLFLGKNRLIQWVFWHPLLGLFWSGFDTTVDFWDWESFTFLPDLCYHLYFDFEDWFQGSLYGHYQLLYADGHFGWGFG